MSKDDLPAAMSGLQLDTASSVKTPFLFEVAWEVCNKVGGIYTVIRSKVSTTIEEFGCNYIAVGPYIPATAGPEFEELEPPTFVAEALKAVEEKQGIKSHYGKWLIPGYPRAVLFEVESALARLDDAKHQMFLQYGYSSPADDHENNTCILFGYAVYVFMLELLSPAAKFAREHLPIVQLHEWQAAVALLFLAKSPVDVATLFTTHATLLGRYMCAGGANSVDFYNVLPSVDADKEAGTRGIFHRHQIEKLGAHMATVFTTVSDITALEAEYLLKRTPDRITPNGLKLEKPIALHEFQNNHALYKERINEFIRGHFYGYYDFDLDNTLYVFTSGRYEYHNKGVDMFIDALAALNARLQSEQSKLTVVAFIIMPARTNNFNVETLKGQSMVKKVRETTDAVAQQIHQRIFESVARGNLPDPSKLISEEEMITLKRRILALKRTTLPPIVTHNMIDDATDPILNHLRRCKLFNAPEDRVKIIFHPEFLNSTNPCIGMEYDQFIRGCHLGIFSSYYEPWGYTPAECTVMGIPSVSSNLTGFANFIQKKVPNHEDSGILVVDRRYRTYPDSVAQLVAMLYRFAQLTRRQRIEMRNRTERLSELLDWNNLGKEYMSARGLALQKTFGLRPPPSPSASLWK